MLSLIIIGILLVVTCLLLYKYKVECDYNSELEDKLEDTESRSNQYYTLLQSKRKLCEQLQEKLYVLRVELATCKDQLVGVSNAKPSRKEENIMKEKLRKKVVPAEGYNTPIVTVNEVDSTDSSFVTGLGIGCLMNDVVSEPSFQGNDGKFDGGGASYSYDAPVTHSHSFTPSHETHHTSYDSGHSSSYSSSDSGSSSCDSGGSCGGCD